MHSLQFTAESSSNGMLERDFTVGGVPGVLWSPASGAVRAPLVLMGHGGGNHKKHPAMAGRHKELPRFEADSAVVFFARHLGRAVTSPA
jgi:hypothetical protein